MPRAGVDEILLVVVAKNVAAEFAPVFLVDISHAQHRLHKRSQVHPGPCNLIIDYGR